MTTEAPMKLWTVAELRDALGVSEKTIRRMIANKRIAVRRYGKTIRIPQSEATRLLEHGSSTR